MKNIKTTNILLLIIVIPLVFFLLKTLKFIFVPLIFAMFIAMLFLPLMRWLSHRKITKALSLLIVILIIAATFKIGGEVVQLASREIMATKVSFFEKAETKLMELIVSIENFFGIQRVDGESMLGRYIKGENTLKNIGITINFIGDTLASLLLTTLFIILLLAGSMNFQKILDDILIHRPYASVKVFRRIEKETVKFIKVKFLVSLLTGILFSTICWLFDVSFPVFWGLMAFLLNFVQMLGSFVVVILLSFFAFVELEPSTTLLFFIITIIAVQLLVGSVLEPVLMGNSLSISIITIIVMLMLWGFIWGIPGMVLSIPITVFLKIIFEQFPRTKKIARLISGNTKDI